MKTENKGFNSIDYTLKAIILSTKLLLFFIILLLFSFLFNYLNIKLSEKSGVAVSKESSLDSQMIVIDAGHGGEDGGAVGINGCLEKELNLSTAINLYDLLRLFDIPAVMTRTEDVMLYDENTPGRKKAQDLKKRLEITKGYEDSLLVSIHMNSYPSPKYNGAQVYYSQNHPEGQILAKEVQNTLSEKLQPTNKRDIKAATSAIYLLHNIKTPAILIECGFISNQRDAELLCTEEYRRKMAASIYLSLVNYLSEKDTTS